MRKTYVTIMPDRIGSFLKASKCFAELGINITRVSYNKAVDTNTLFIDAEGSKEQLSKADKMLSEIGYIGNNKSEPEIVLIEFRLRDVPGSVTEILELINSFNFNISYISSGENGTGYQSFKMGLYIDDTDKISQFIKQSEKICPTQIIDYNQMRKVYDNSIFYNSFINGLVRTMDLSAEARQALLVNVNLAMQTLDEHGLSPHHTFDSISKFSEILAAHKNEGFTPRITTHSLSENTSAILIEPPCGSNTIILQSGNNTLFIDTGYTCYREEMLNIFRTLIPDFDTMEKTALITHADLDHCGLLYMFDKIIASRKSAECLTLEYEDKDGFREQSQLHKPYINMCKVLTSFTPPTPDKFVTPWEDIGTPSELLTRTGYFDFGDMHFEVYEGKGGHLPGETVLIDYSNHVAFTGDIYINLKDMTPEQSEYNKYAPILMTSVDTEKEICSRERESLLSRLGMGNWKVFGGHGNVKKINMNSM